MPQVETARGPVDAQDLGQVLMHEHVFTLTADVQQNYPSEWGDEEQRVADAVAKLQEVAALGVRTIVDPTVVGLGRYVPRIARVAEQVPELNIVVATGPVHVRRRAVLLPPPGSGAVGGGRLTTSRTRWSRCSSATSATASPVRGSRPGCSSAPSTSRA